MNEFAKKKGKIPEILVGKLRTYVLNNQMSY